jgi:hypothetical protein
VLTSKDDSPFWYHRARADADGRGVVKALCSVTSMGVTDDMPRW